MRRRTVAGFLLTLLTASSCLFETIPPQRTGSGPSGEPPLQPDEVVITGLVRLLDRRDRRSRNMPYYAVRATWYNADLREIDRTIVYSGNGGVYRFSYRNSRLSSVDLQALLCQPLPGDQSCCLDNPPCQTGCNIWTRAERLGVVPGHRFQRDLTVGCDSLP